MRRAARKIALVYQGWVKKHVLRQSRNKSANPRHFCDGAWMYVWTRVCPGIVVAYLPTSPCGMRYAIPQVLRGSPPNAKQYVDIPFMIVSMGTLVTLLKKAVRSKQTKRQQHNHKPHNTLYVPLYTCIPSWSWHTSILDELKVSSPRLYFDVRWG